MTHFRPQVSYQAELRRPDSFHVDAFSYAVSAVNCRPGCVTKELRNLHITSLRSELNVFQDLLFLAKEKFNNGCEMVSGCILKIYYSGAPLTFRNAIFSQLHDKLYKPFCFTQLLLI